MSDMKINSVLAQMRLMSERVERASRTLHPAEGIGEAGKANQNDFTAMLGQAIRQVNQLQKTAGASQEAFQRGEDISLTEVMINTQKASVAFSGMVEVRNKLVSAYQEIMNMPV